MSNATDDQHEFGSDEDPWEVFERHEDTLRQIVADNDPMEPDARAILRALNAKRRGELDV